MPRRRWPLFLLLCGLLGPWLSAWAQERVTLQLKWSHAFQFAGYYAAQAQGYYRDAGLDVRILPAAPGTDTVQEVLAGRAQYGVGTSNLLLNRQAGQPVVALAVIFQHSPLVLLARQAHPTASLHDLRGQRVMFEPHSDELQAYLQAEGLPLAGLRQLPHSQRVDDLIEGQVDAMSAYATYEPYFLEQAKVAYQVYTPRSGGIDFYGDNLFTTEKEIREHPERVAAFRAASLRGWQYAMAHVDETVALIRQQYSDAHPAEFHQFEARKMAPLLQVDLIEVGYMNPGRWRHIAQTYHALGLLPADFSLQGFLYQQAPPRIWDHPYFWASLAGLALSSAAAAYVMVTNRRLRQHVGALHQAQAQLAESQALYQSILFASPDAIVLTDLHGAVQVISPAGRRLLGLAPSAAPAGRPLLAFLHPDDQPRIQSHLMQLAQGQSVPAQDYRLLSPAGIVLEVEVNAEAVRDPQGHPQALVWVGRDVSERKQAEARIRHLAEHDSLTGLVNRARLHQRLEEALAQARRETTGVAVLMLDLDEFKPVNDTHGHAVGDALLQAVAGRLRACAQPGDTVARLGGDEFVMLLPQVRGMDEALARAEALRDSLSQAYALPQTASTGETLPRMRVSCSVGLAIYPDHANDATRLLQRADQAMYLAKQAGRNQVQCSAPAG